MKIQPNQSLNFLNKDFQQYQGVLIFGNNAGLVSKRCDLLQQKFINPADETSFNSLNLDYEQVAKDPSLLYEELNSYSMLGTPKIITIDSVSKSINKKIIDILSSSGGDNFIIFRGGEFPPSSSTRKFFETNKNFAALACYYDNAESIKNILISKLSVKNVKFASPEVMDYILENIQGDHLSVVSEIEKIALFAQSDSILSLKEIKSIINKHSYNTSYDELIKNIINNKLDKAEIEFSKLTYSGVSIVAIIRNITNYFVKLLKVKTLITQGKAEHLAMSFLRPPIFYKYEADFKNGLKKYTVSKLTEIIESLIKLEIDCKTYNIDPQIMWNQSFIALFSSNMEV
jgi:DNA polymerase III subunit delta